ncbi:MFS transporter [Paenibacillus sp. NPDC056933]|uniref:MFS transporter n=1 Tax=Paenibacillus sp. NPDC056933 TaxID=3345968 RepID=UPI0036309CB6
MNRLWTKSFIGMTLTLFFLFFGFYLLMPTLPLYIKQLGISESQVGLIVGVFTLAAVIARPIVGGLLDKFGRRVFIIVGLIVFGVSIYFYNWTAGIGMLILLRIIHGFGWALSSTAIGTSITDVIPADRRGEGMGWYGMATSISMALGPIIGLWIIQRSSFSNLFIFILGLTLVSFLIAMITKIPFAKSEHSRRIEFFDKSVLPASLAIFFLSFTYGGITTFMPLFAESIHVSSSTFFLVYAITLTASRPIAGKLADRYSERTIIFPSLIIAAIALLVLSFSDGLSGIIWAAILYGIGFGAAQPTLQAVILRLVPSHKKGVANASYLTALDLGIGVGAILLGVVSQYMGYKMLFTVCVISALISLLIFVKFVKQNVTSSQK